MKRSSYIQKIIKYLAIKNKNSEQAINSTPIKKNSFSTNIHKNEQLLKELLGNSQDVTFSKLKIKIKNAAPLDALLVAIDGLVDEKAKRNNIIKPLIEIPLEKRPNGNLHSIQQQLSVKGIDVEENVINAVNTILKSRALLLVDGISKGLLISIEGFEIRSIEEPETEQVVRGAREGFIESTSVNLSMIRRRIAHPSLRFETIEIGKYSQIDVTIAYVIGIADPKLINRVRNRLKQIKVDTINNSGEIEQLIEDQPYSIFPTIGNTERPDRTASLLMEGKVSILINGDPVSLFVPFQFVESIKNIEDYNSRPYYSSFIRLIRFFAFGLSITLPALYITAVNFNKSLIPSDLILPLTIARETVPFPLALEVIIMILMFELVREAGVRLPKQVGTAISIVGPLILGEVAVSSSIASSPTLIIVSVSYIAAFVITSIADVTALLRIALFIAASIFGAFGLIVPLLAVFTHMVSLTSLGIPYMSPFSPFHFKGWKDALVRFPTKFLKYRMKNVPNRHQKNNCISDTED